MDKARNLSTIDPLAVLKGVDQRLLAEVLDIVRATSTDAGKLGTVGNGQESDRDGWGQTVPQGSKSTVKERAVPLRSILKQPSTSTKIQVEDLGSGGTVSDSQRNAMDGWLPAPSKARLRSEGERDAKKGAEEIGKAIETVVRRQFMTDARTLTGVQASKPWGMGINEGHFPRFRPPFVRPIDPVIGSCQMRPPIPPPWHLRGEDHLRPPYPPPFGPLADRMVARPRLLAPPAEYNTGSQSHLVVPSQYNAYRQVSQLPVPERAGPQLYRGDRPFMVDHGEGRFFPEFSSPSDAAFADSWQGPRAEPPVLQMFGGGDKDMNVKHVPEELKRSSFASREIIDHQHKGTNLDESSRNSERISFRKGDYSQRKRGRRRQSEESATGNRREDESHGEMELKQKFIKKIVGVVLPCDQEPRDRDDTQKSRRLETLDSGGRLEKSAAEFPAPFTEPPAPRGDCSRKTEGANVADLDDDDEKLRRKLLSEVERRKRDLERNLELYRLQNAATEKSFNEFEKVLRKDSTGEWTDLLSFNNTRPPDVEFKDFCGFPGRKMEARNTNVDSEDEDMEMQASFLDPNFISACKSIATAMEKRNKMETTKEQSEIDDYISPNSTEKFSGIANEAQELIFAPENDIRRSTPELNTRPFDGSTTTKTRAIARNEAPYPPPSSTSRSSAKFAEEPVSSPVRCSTASTPGRADTITESETGKFTEFLMEERAAFWENLKAQLGEHCASQAPLGGAIGAESKAKTDERSDAFPPSISDHLNKTTKTVDLEEKRKESKEMERHKKTNEELEVKEKKRRTSDSNKKSLQSGKPKLGDTLDNAGLKIQPEIFSREQNRNKAVGKETKKPEQAKRQVSHASRDKKAFEDDLKTFGEDADWRPLISPEVVLNKDAPRRGETWVKNKPFSSSNVASKPSKIVRGVPRKAGAHRGMSGRKMEAGNGMSGPRNEGCEFRQKTGPKLVSNDKDSRIRLTKKSQNTNNLSLYDRVIQRKLAQLKKKSSSGNGKFSAGSDHNPKNDDILYSDIEDDESSEEEEKTHSLDHRAKDDVDRETEIKDIREKSHEDYDGRHLDRNTAAFDQDQRRFGFDSPNKTRNKSGFKIRLDANSGRRRVEGFHPPGTSGTPRQKRGFKDVDMRHHRQEGGYRAEDFSGRDGKETFVSASKPDRGVKTKMTTDEERIHYGKISDKTNPMDRGNYPKFKNRYPRGRFGNQHMASGVSGGFQKNFYYSDTRELHKSRHDSDDRKDQGFARNRHLYEHPEEHTLHFGTRRGSQPHGPRFTNERRNDDEGWYKEPDYRPDPDYKDTWNQDDVEPRRSNSNTRCSDDGETLPKFIRPFQTEGRRFPRPETVWSEDHSGTFDEVYCLEEEEEEPMEEDVELDWNDHDRDDREAATGGHRWKNRAFGAHRGRVFRHGNAANMKQRFWKHKPWNNANRTGVRLPGSAYRQNFTRQHRNKLDFKKAKTSSSVLEKAWNSEGTLPGATSHSLQDIIKDVMAKVDQAKAVDPAADEAMFQSLSRGEKKQVLEVQQMTGIASKTVIVTALRTLWELEPKVVRTLGGLEPDVIQQIGDDR